MKNFIIVALIVVGLGAFLWHSESPKTGPVGAGGGSGVQFWYASATTTNYSVGTSWWNSPVLPYDSTRGYASFCNNSVVANNFVYLGLGATTSGASGIQIAPSSCYEMTQEKMFYGNIYFMASTSSTTLMSVVGKY